MEPHTQIQGKKRFKQFLRHWQPEQYLLHDSHDPAILYGPLVPLFNSKSGEHSGSGHKRMAWYKNRWQSLTLSAEDVWNSGSELKKFIQPDSILLCVQRSWWQKPYKCVNPMWCLRILKLLFRQGWKNSRPNFLEEYALRCVPWYIDQSADLQVLWIHFIQQRTFLQPICRSKKQNKFAAKSFQNAWVFWNQWLQMQQLLADSWSSQKVSYRRDTERPFCSFTAYPTKLWHVWEWEDQQQVWLPIHPEPQTVQSES